MKTIAAAVLLLLLLASGGTAQEVTIELPPDNPFGRLQPGPHSELAQTQCQFCHSTDYVVTQPRVDAKQWDGVVNKMIKVFGAPISPEDAKAITEYLATTYGPGR